MTTEEQLTPLARRRDDAVTSAAERGVSDPGNLYRQLRHYLQSLVDRKRMSTRVVDALRLTTQKSAINDLRSAVVEFASGSKLEFNIQVEKSQDGWMIVSYEFHLSLPQSRAVKMVRLHLNRAASHRPLHIPRCHMHVGDSEAHVPIPAMTPLMLLHLICEILEPDISLASEEVP